MHRGRERTSYIPFLLNQETRSDVIPVRLHFSDTLPQARQPISHRRVCLNNGLVTITHLKVSHGDLISFKENDARTRGFEIRRSFYIDISVGKIIGKFLSAISVGKRRGKFLPARIWRRTKKEWFRLLTTQRGCRLLLKSKELQKLRSYMQEEDFERTKKFGSAKVCLGSSFAEHNRMKRNFNSTYCSGSPFTRKIRIKRIELPTHYSKVNHRTLKAVVSYGPNIGHIPHDIRLKDPNLPLRSGNGRGQNI
ncbi:hypothetical protein VPH35_014156 [Triticum aestivum]